MAKITFKRKRGGDSKWGAGLDYIFKDYWGKLDILVEDNYYRRHNSKLINFLFPKMLIALEGAILKIKNEYENKKDKEGLSDWVRKAGNIKKFGKSAKTLDKKTIFIDSIVQFLRETSLRKNPKKVVRSFAKKEKLSKRKKMELKGLVASKAHKVKGRVKIVLYPDEIKKLKKGEVLVTRETNVGFLPAMIKACAFITDAGGMLCHAAIISRELKKPCIVDTKIATKVLKDGDLVEIDTGKGIVKIIN